MTRKRFIKLMMSYGFSRNEAVEMASEVSQYWSYESMYRVVSEWPSLGCKIFVDLAASFDRFSAGLKAVDAALCTFGASLRRAAKYG